MSGMANLNREIEEIIFSAGQAERMGFPIIASGLYQRAADRQLQLAMQARTPTARGAMCQLALVWMKKSGDYLRALQIAQELSGDSTLPEIMRSSFEDLVTSLKSHHW